MKRDALKSVFRACTDGSMCYELVVEDKFLPSGEIAGSGYSTSARHKPCGGIVGPDFERSRSANSSGISSGLSLPRPTSTRVPAIFLTMYRRKDFPRTT